MSVPPHHRSRARRHRHGGLALALLLAVGAALADDGRFARDLLARDWLRYGDGHFTVISDRAPAAVLAQLAELQRFRATWLMLNDATPGEDVIGTRVILFARGADLAQFLGNPAYAGLFVPTLRANYMLLADTGRGNHRNEVLFHELSHVLARSSGRVRVPLWYAEGSADLYASLDIGANGVVLGRVPRVRLASLQALRGRPLRLAPVLRRTDFEATQPEVLAEFYAVAWLLTHYLELGPVAGHADRRARLADYLARFQRGEDPVAAFRHAFGALETMQAELARYLFDTPRRRVELSPPAGDAAVDQRDRLTRVAASTELALAAAALQPDLADTIAAAASDRDATPGPALLALRARLAGLRGAHHQALELAERARALDPESPDVDLAWGNAIVSRCTTLRMGAGCRLRVEDALAAFDRVSAVRPGDAEALFGRGAALALLLRHDAAIEALQQALARAPWSAVLQYRLGIAHANAGNLDAAREHLQRTLAWSEGSDIGRHAAQLLRVLDGKRPRPQRRDYLAPPTPGRTPPD